MKKQRITLKFNDGKNDLFIYSDTDSMRIPEEGEYVSYNSKRYRVDKVTTNINIFDKGCNTIGEFDRVSIYIKLIIVNDNKTDLVEEKNVDKVTGNKSVTKKDIEDLKTFISNIEFKVTQELDEDENPILTDSSINELSDKIDKLIRLMDPPTENVSSKETEENISNTLYITRKFCVKKKAGRGYSVNNIAEFEIPGLKLKTKDITIGKIYKNSNGEINYLDEVEKDENGIYRGVEINNIYIDTSKMLKYGYITTVDDIQEMNLDDFIRMSLKYPEAVNITNHIDDNDKYSNTQQLMIYHKVNK